MKVFILEDSINRQICFQEALTKHNVIIAPNVPRAQHHWAAGGPYDLLLLDHDVGESVFDPTGYDFCRWLVKISAKPIETVIHSYNPDGAKRMKQTLSENGWDNITVLPFGMTLLKRLEAL